MTDENSTQIMNVLMTPSSDSNLPLKTPIFLFIKKKPPVYNSIMEEIIQSVKSNTLFVSVLETNSSIACHKGRSFPSKNVTLQEAQERIGNLNARDP